jgi:hypothetical protein
MRSSIDTLKKHYLNSRGKRLGKKYVIFESDDWGSERITSKKDMDALIKSGIDLYSNPHNHLDSLETEDDLTALFDVLGQFRDKNGNHPVITANSVVANPDFQKIKASGFTEYHFETAIETYGRKQESANCPAVIEQGISAGMYHPQFHGREHLNVNSWLAELQSGNEVLHKAFDHGIYGIDLDAEFTGRTNFMAAFDSYLENEIEVFGSIIKEGSSLFKDQFGYTSESFIAPCYAWHPNLEPHLKANGISFLQGLPIQFIPDLNGTHKEVFNHQGKENKNGQYYIIRNCFFEPAYHSGTDLIAECLRRLKIIFFWGKPAVISTHRINFSGSLDENNRRINLDLLKHLLQLILKTWPEVEFITTDKLGRIYKNGSE